MLMEMRYPAHPDAVKRMTTDELRAQFHLSGLFVPARLNMAYTHIDRMIVGAATPTVDPLLLAADPAALGADYFLQRREVGIINIGDAGTISVDGADYPMAPRDGLYVGMGAREVIFRSARVDTPAQFYFSSVPAHAAHVTQHIPPGSAAPAHLGSAANSNVRTIYKYIHPEGVRSCQLVMGLTQLEPNNMWNTMPPHTHARRMEIYLYFDLAAPNVVFHLMGEPDETRHIVMRDREAVISPSWSIHSGMGTGNYAFIWAMAGENQTFSDMDAVGIESLR
jgi:4-deoxy-L-threo-5-hexosulose-uronate ketol-isomerase